eukprot:5744810-Amphidinium_carterae.1
MVASKTIDNENSWNIVSLMSRLGVVCRDPTVAAQSHSTVSRFENCGEVSLEDTRDVPALGCFNLLKFTVFDCVISDDILASNWKMFPSVLICSGEQISEDSS